MNQTSMNEDVIILVRLTLTEQHALLKLSSDLCFCVHPLRISNDIQHAVCQKHSLLLSRRSARQSLNQEIFSLPSA